MKKVKNRQRRWQLVRKGRGLCEKCGKAAFYRGGRCYQCYEHEKQVRYDRKVERGLCQVPWCKELVAGVTVVECERHLTKDVNVGEVVDVP